MQGSSTYIVVSIYNCSFCLVYYVLFLARARSYGLNRNVRPPSIRAQLFLRQNFNTSFMILPNFKEYMMRKIFQKLEQSELEGST